MNIHQLKKAEETFLRHYPGGFGNPNLVYIGKRHKLDRMSALARKSLSLTALQNTNTVKEDLILIVSRSSMISMYEKPKYRDYIRSVDEKDTIKLIDGMKELLHGNQQQGFEKVQQILNRAKLAKWSLMTIFLTYYHIHHEVFIKPSTTKDIIQFLEIDNIVYNPTPSWDFYQEYRSIINHIKTLTDESLAPANAAFCGFLMIAMKLLNSENH